MSQNKTCYCKNCQELQLKLDAMQKEIEYWKTEHSKQVEKQENDSYHDLD